MHSYAQPQRDPREIIEDLRIKQGFRSVRALAIAADVPQPTLQRYLSGKTDAMEVKNLMALARTLGVTLSELMGEVAISNGGPLRELSRLVTDLNELELQQLVDIGRVLRTRR